MSSRASAAAGRPGALLLCPKSRARRPAATGKRSVACGACQHRQFPSRCCSWQSPTGTPRPPAGPRPTSQPGPWGRGEQGHQHAAVRAARRRRRAAGGAAVRAARGGQRRAGHAGAGSPGPRRAVHQRRCCESQPGRRRGGGRASTGAGARAAEQRQLGVELGATRADGPLQPHRRRGPGMPPRPLYAPATPAADAWLPRRWATGDA